MIDRHGLGKELILALVRHVGLNVHADTHVKQKDNQTNHEKFIGVFTAGPHLCL